MIYSGIASGDTGASPKRPEPEGKDVLVSAFLGARSSRRPPPPDPHWLNIQRLAGPDPHWLNIQLLTGPRC